MRKRYLVVCMVFLLVISSIGSLSFGYKLSENEISIDNSGTSQTLVGPMDSPWPMQSHDLHHTGLSPYSTANNSYFEKWKFAFGPNFNNIFGGPIIDNNGTIYFGGGQHIYALYINGTMKWTITPGGWINSTPAIGEDGTIYIGSWHPGRDYTNPSLFLAINSDGTWKWSVHTEGHIESSPAIGEDGTIYFGTDSPENSIVAVNPNGTIKWSYPTNNSVTSDPAIGDDGTIYFGSCDNYFYALCPNGTLKWRFKTGDYIRGPASIANDGTIYVGSQDDYLYAFYPNGTMKWKFNVGYGTEANPSITSDGTIYVSGSDYLFAVYPNGTLKWSFFLGEGKQIGTSYPAISADGTIYFGVSYDGGGDIVAINPDGTERWRKRIADMWICSPPAIAEDGTIYICSYCNFSFYLNAFGNMESNNPPDAPSISGETDGSNNWDYMYIFRSNDPDNSPVSFYIEWGDGSSTGWTSEKASGEDYRVYHLWSEPGTYTIKAKAKDNMGEESDWGTLKVTMPRTRISYGSLFLRFLEWLPNAFPVLKYVSGGRLV